MSLTLIKYVLKAAIRDKLMISLLVVMLITTSLSVFMGSSAIVEKDQFSLVFASGGLRLAGTFSLVLFVVFFLRRSFEARDVEYLLARPVGRVQFLLSYATAFSLIAIFTALIQSLSLYILGPHLFNAGSFFWCFSVMIENIIMVNTALFFAMFLSSAASGCMAVFAFYVLGRMMGQILGILQASEEASIFEGLEYVMQMISVLTPRLDLMGQSAWILYGAEGDAGLTFLTVQGGLFCMLVLSAALIDLVRRQF